MISVESAIARAQALQPQLNCMTLTLYDEARAAQPPAGPLAGMPTLIKDLTDLKGARTSRGGRAFLRRAPAAEHDPHIAAALAAGLIPIGKSNTPEFGYAPITEPLAFGPTRNPWNLAFSPGGSSGGAAAAVAARIVPLAHATDGGGSIRIPAACCGVFGLKPSRGRVIKRPPAAGAPMDLVEQGCISLSVADSANYLHAVQSPSAALRRVSGPGTRRLRIGVLRADFQNRPPEADCAAALADAAAFCSALGHSLVEAAAPLDGAAFADAFLTYWSSGVADDIAAARAEQPDAPLEAILEPLTLMLHAHWEQKAKPKFAAALETLKASAARFLEAFSAFDVLLTPSLASPPPLLGALTPKPGGFLENQEKAFRFNAYCPIVNVAGACAMSVPLHWNAANLPIGVQFIAPPGQDETLLELAFELEAARPWANRKPPISG